MIKEPYHRKYIKKYESLYDIFLISERIMDKMCIKKNKKQSFISLSMCMTINICSQQ